MTEEGPGGQPNLHLGKYTCSVTWLYHRDVEKPSSPAGRLRHAHRGLEEAQEEASVRSSSGAPALHHAPHSSHRTEYLVQEPSCHAGLARPIFGTGLSFESLPLLCHPSQAYFGDREQNSWLLQLQD